MVGNTPKEALSSVIQAASLSHEEIRDRIEQIQSDLMFRSAHVRAPNFSAIHQDDLQLLYQSYDQAFFHGQLQRGLEGRVLTFRLSPRMTRAGGTTTRSRWRANGDETFEIAIASSLLFDQFRGENGIVTACGIECRNRLQVLQRIFEHELIHLAEYLCWNASDCAGKRFQDAARRLFLHESHTHSLITRREQAARSGIRAGSRVSFVFEGKMLVGRVNRVTKRVTVLVPDEKGRRFSDGIRYSPYYVPLAGLKLVEEEPKES